MSMYSLALSQGSLTSKSSEEGLKLEMSALESLYGGSITLDLPYSVDKTKHSFLLSIDVAPQFLYPPYLTKVTLH